MEFGSHCSLSTCNKLDFLPLHCQCNQSFCADHIAQDSHHCPLTVSVSPTPSSNPTPARQCGVDRCQKLALAAIHSTDLDSELACSACHEFFCAKHRHRQAHPCVEDKVEASSSTQTARALLAKNFPSTKSAPVAKSTLRVNKPKSAAAKQVQLMKMRQSAVPGDSRDKPILVSIGDRLHLKVKIGEEGEEKLYWFRKAALTGRVVDCLAAGMDRSRPLELSSIHADNPAERTTLQNDQPISSQAEDGSVVILSPKSQQPLQDSESQ